MWPYCIPEIGSDATAGRKTKANQRTTPWDKLMNSIRLIDVKQALKDGRFRNAIPSELQPEVEKYLRNPTCACNTKFYRTVLQKCQKQLEEYFPGKCIEDQEEKTESLPTNSFTVINCHKDELESRLRRLPNGRKQIAVARFEDQVTAIVNEMDLLE